MESLDFSVGSEKDVDITVMDTEGWQLHQASPTVFIISKGNYYFHLPWLTHVTAS